MSPPRAFRQIEADLLRARADYEKRPVPDRARVHDLLDFAAAKLVSATGETTDDDERLNLAWLAIREARRGVAT